MPRRCRAHGVGARPRWRSKPMCADEASCRALIATISRTPLGRLDILVNNAGTAYRKPPQDYTLADWQRVIDVNLTGAFVCAHAAYPHMVRAGGGKIINIGSMLSIFATSYAVAYAASKGGIVQMTKALRVRLGQGQHPGQRDPAGLDRYRVHPHCAARGAGAPRARARAHAGRPLGQPGRSLRSSRSSLPAPRRVSSPGPRFRDSSSAAFRRKAEFCACPGKVATGFPNRTCANQRFAAHPDRNLIGIGLSSRGRDPPAACKRRPSGSAPRLSTNSARDELVALRVQAADMRQHDDALRAPERMLRRQRLLAEHIEHRAGDRSWPSAPRSDRRPPPAGRGRS